MVNRDFYSKLSANNFGMSDCIWLIVSVVLDKFFNLAAKVDGDLGSHRSFLSFGDLYNENFQHHLSNASFSFFISPVLRTEYIKRDNPSLGLKQMMIGQTQYIYGD